jgi:hypothetical protein
MTTGVLWPSLYQGDGTRIRKWLYGSVLIRDWDANGTTAMNSLQVFLANGNLNPNLLVPTASGGNGFYDVGSITENGVEFNPQFTTDETMIWQSRRSQRTDITRDDEEITFSAMESTPLIDYIWYNLPIGFTGVPTFPSIGASNYGVTKPFYSDVLFRQLLIIGVDGSVGVNGQPEYIAELRPRVTLQKKAKKQYQAKQADVTELTYSVHIDPWSGFDTQVLRGGSVWLAEGGFLQLPATSSVTATATAGHTATLVFNVPNNFLDGIAVPVSQPGSQNTPVNYTVSGNDTTTSTIAPATVSGVAVSSGVATVTLSGLTVAQVYNFTITATGANGTSVTFPVSNNITST